MAAFGVQLLKRGLALCGKNFANFVEAWNHVVQRSANICGDADANPADGYISVDNANPDHPVIRFDASKLPAASAASAASVLPSAFQATPTWVEKNGGMYVDSITISNCYYMVGGKTMAVGSGWTFTYTASAVIALKLTSTGAGFASPEVVLYASLGDAQAAQSSADTYVVPLYEMTNEESGILIDLRTMPQIQAFEFNLT